MDGQKKPVNVEAGQFITGCHSLHRHYYPKKKRKKKGQKSPRTLWRWVKILEELQNLSIESNQQYSRVTINNWKTYQIDGLPDEQRNEQRVSNERATHEQRTITNKNDLRMNKNEGKKQLPPNFHFRIDPKEVQAIMDRNERLSREFNL